MIRLDDPIEICEAYLDQVSRGISKKVSAFERDDTIRELRTHLLAAAAAYEELGLGPVAAMDAAIEKFGDRERIQRQLIRETRNSPPKNLASILSVAVATLLGGAFLTIADFCVYLTHIVSNPSSGMWPVGCVIGCFVGISMVRHRRTPLIAGLRSGVMVPSCLLLVTCLLNRRVPDLGFLSAFLIAFGCAGFLTSFLASWANQILRRDLPNTSGPRSRNA